MAVEIQDIYFVCDGPPGPESGRFVEVEDAEGRGLSVGEWEQDGQYWRLGPVKTILELPETSRKKPTTVYREPDHVKAPLIIQEPAADDCHHVVANHVNVVSGEGRRFCVRCGRRVAWVDGKWRTSSEPADDDTVRVEVANASGDGDSDPGAQFDLRVHGIDDECRTSTEPEDSPALDVEKLDKGLRKIMKSAPGSDAQLYLRERVRELEEKVVDYGQKILNLRSMIGIAIENLTSVRDGAEQMRMRTGTIMGQLRQSLEVNHILPSDGDPDATG